MGSLQYENEWNHGREKEHSIQCSPKLLNGGQVSCCGALEGQISPEKDQGTAGYVRGNVEASFGPCQETLQMQVDDIQYLKNLVESLPRRLEAVILNKGNSTKY